MRANRLVVLAMGPPMRRCQGILYHERQGVLSVEVAHHREQGAVNNALAEFSVGIRNWGQQNVQDERSFSIRRIIQESPFRPVQPAQPFIPALCIRLFPFPSAFRYPSHLLRRLRPRHRAMKGKGHRANKAVHTDQNAQGKVSLEGALALGCPSQKRLAR